MKCGWSKLDKFEKDCEKVNLKNVGPTFFKLKSVQSETRLQSKRLRNHLCLLFK